MITLPLPERFTRHRELVATVAEAGVQPPPRWSELDGQLAAYLALPDSATQRLAEAVISPKKADLVTLRALAIAEASVDPQRLARVNHVVLEAVERELHEAYAPQAQQTYRTLADRFDAQAAEFMAAATAADTEADAASMVTADDSQRRAWVQAELGARSLEATLPALAAAAQLAGIRLIANPEAPMWWAAPVTKGALIALAVSTDGLHRRRVWEAWQATGRCGRWGALVAMGAEVKAHSLIDFEVYREPRPLIYRQRQVAGEARGIVENITEDPEDLDYVASVEPIDPVRSRGMFV